MEFADNGDLFQKICDHQKNNTHFPEDDIWRIFIQVVRGLRSLHELNIMHRDLKVFCNISTELFRALMSFFLRI